MGTLKAQNVKDILQSRNKSNYEMLTSEIRDFILREKKKKDQIDEKHNSCMDNVYERINSKVWAHNSHPMKDIIYPESRSNYEAHDKNTKQISQMYQSFGKVINADKNGNNMKKLIHTQVENCSSKIKTLNLQNIVADEYNGQVITSNDLNIYEALQEAPVSTQIHERKACISYLNKIRLQLKKRNVEMDLLTVRHHFNCIDKDNQNTINFDKFIQILEKIDINLNTKMFSSVLDQFGLIKNNLVYYDKALKLLYWKYHLPPIMKINDLSQEWQFYRTTYQEFMHL